jgi:hypothetical protein
MTQISVNSVAAISRGSVIERPRAFPWANLPRRTRSRNVSCPIRRCEAMKKASFTHFAETPGVQKDAQAEATSHLSRVTKQG